MSPVEELEHDLDVMFDKLFGRRDVKMTYHWNSGSFVITLDGEDITHRFHEVHKMYDYLIRVEGLGSEFNSYEEMLALVEKEGLSLT